MQMNKLAAAGTPSSKLDGKDFAPTQSGTDDVLQVMKDRGAGPAEMAAAENEAAKVKSALESTAKGGKMGFKKGGLASKKKKK